MDSRSLSKINPADLLKHVTNAINALKHAGLTPEHVEQGLTAMNVPANVVGALVQMVANAKPNPGRIS